ncbi:MAG: RNA recognition motif domain-containing protein [Roseimicrobium sp.]
MSDNKPNAAGRAPQGRGRGGRRRRGGKDHRGEFRTERKPELSGFQKFLSAVSFGLYKPSESAPRGTGKPLRTPREDGPVARSEREARQGDRQGGRQPERREKRQRPAPVSAEVTGERLYVGNLHFDATESDLFELFNGAGRVKNAEVVVNNQTQRSKGFAFVTMMSLDEAKKAVAELNNKDFMGRPLVVGGAKPPPPRDERRRPERAAAEDDDDTIRPPADDEEEERAAA